MATIPVPTYVFGNLVPQAAELACQFCCGLRFMGREFRMLVQIEIQSVRLGIDGTDFLRARSGLRDGRGNGHQQKNIEPCHVDG